MSIVLVYSRVEVMQLFGMGRSTDAVVVAGGRTEDKSRGYLVVEDVDNVG